MHPPCDCYVSTKPYPDRGFYPHDKACASLRRRALDVEAALGREVLNAICLIMLSLPTACATGPQRAGMMGGDATHGIADEPKASPMSVGPMLAVVMPLNGGPVRPAELLGGTVRLNSEGRAFNAMVFGGFAAKSFSTPADGGLTGGLGASVELTPGNLLYSVDLGGGVVFGDFGPAACIGVTIQTKM